MEASSVENGRVDRWLDYLGLDRRMLLLPLFVPLVVFAVFVVQYGVPHNRTMAEGLAIILLASVIAGFLALAAGLPAWIAGWMVARRSGRRRYASKIIAAGVGAFAGTTGFQLAMALQYGIDPQTVWSALSIASVAAAISMALAAVIYWKWRGDAARGAE